MSARYLLASAVLVSWACAKEVQQDPGSEPYMPGHDAGGSGGRSTQVGGGGSSAALGGSSPTGSGGAGGTVLTGGVGGAAGGGGRTASGGGTVTAGRSASGGGNATAGRSASGGASATGGANATGGISAGGNASGGRSSVGGASNGGTGMAGVPNDPNWKPPDMTATATVIAYYQVQQTAASSTEIRFTLTFKNTTTTALDTSNVKVRYWMTAEPAPDPHVDSSSTGLKFSSVKYVVVSGMTCLEFSFGTGGQIPPYVDQNTLNNTTQLQVRVASKINNTNFNQANDWSFNATSTVAAPNPKITVYAGDTLLWGCDPAHVCASAPAAGEGGMGGQGAL